jgi:hypothetical protein
MLYNYINKDIIKYILSLYLWWDEINELQKYLPELYVNEKRFNVTEKSYNNTILLRVIWFDDRIIQKKIFNLDITKLIKNFYFNSLERKDGIQMLRINREITFLKKYNNGVPMEYTYYRDNEYNRHLDDKIVLKLIFEKEPTYFINHIHNITHADKLVKMCYVDGKLAGNQYFNEAGTLLKYENFNDLVELHGLQFSYVGANFVIFTFYWHGTQIDNLCTEVRVGERETKILEGIKISENTQFLIHDWFVDARNN